MAYGLTQSLTLNGTTQYASAADSSSLSPTGDMTLETWIKVAALPTSLAEFDIIAKHDNGNTANGRSFIWSLADNSGTPGFKIRISTDGTSGNQSTTTFAYTAPIATWVHLAMSYTAATGVVVFTVNGVNIGNVGGNKTSIFDSTTAVTVGARGDGSSTGITSFSLARIWKGVAQSSATIAANLCSVLGTQTNLSAEWTLNNVYTDDSGNSNTLTPQNSPTFSASVPAICVVADIKTMNGVNKADIKTIDGIN